MTAGEKEFFKDRGLGGYLCTSRWSGTQAELTGLGKFTVKTEKSYKVGRGKTRHIVKKLEGR